LNHKRFPQQREFTLAGSSLAIGPVVNEVLRFITQERCVEGKEAQVALALEEALANAVVHGCGNDPAKRVRCYVGCGRRSGVMIVVRDPGEGFDPASAASPLLPRRLMLEHGRGLHMIRELMDEVSFARHGAEISMRKK